ncbi:pleckstrin homology domain-containing family O member 1b isoform X2 [Pungitius pungitius]|uniref:pleckstrin homology domain-containing family O member 1b isoform X2 n=1 Tax=Pungitius pungitius TaxID=134920 RepID=UPI001886E4E9|nr:pleckstrin homology domain-containing family O member 1b isoform X2 [Pungitius pungitius]
MKKNSSGKRGPQDVAPQQVQPDKVGWIRKFCGKGIFREIWKNRFVVLKGDQLFVCEKEVKELGRSDEVLDLSDYERCEEIRKKKSRSKKNHSKFRLQRRSSPGNTVPNLVFLAVSPEEKESWISVLNVSITRAKNQILDEVTVEDSQLSHLTRDRVKIPQNRRLPTRGHLLAVASSSSDGMLTLDLIQEDEAPPHLGPDCPRSKTDGALSAEASGKSQSLPREVVWEKTGRTPQMGRILTPAEKIRCASMDEILAHSEATGATDVASAAASVARLQGLISQKLEETERLLTEVQAEAKERGRGRGRESTEAGRLLKEAEVTWGQARDVLEEVKELRALCRQLDSSSPPSTLRQSEPGRSSPVRSGTVKPGR